MDSWAGVVAETLPLEVPVWVFELFKMEMDKTYQNKWYWFYASCCLCFKLPIYG